MTRASGFHLYLVRHGESANNALPESQRVSDPALTTLGEKQVSCLARHYASFDRIDHVLASPFRRTLQTAQPLLLVRQISADIWPELYEVGGCFSGYEREKFTGEAGMTETEIRSEFPEFRIPAEIDQCGWYKKRPHESWEEAALRAKSQAKKLRDEFENKDKTVFCIIHADFKQLLLQHLVPHQSEYHSGLIANTSVTHLHFDKQQGNVVDYCNTDHLQRGDESF